MAGGQFAIRVTTSLLMLTYPCQTKQQKKKSKKTKEAVPAPTTHSTVTESPAPNGKVTDSAKASTTKAGSTTKRHLAPRVEEVEDE